MTSEDIRKISMEQSAIDLNCLADDFKQSKNKVVISKFNEGSKKCFKEAHFCQFVYYGNGLVASVDERIEKFITTFINNNLAYYCFDTPQTNVLNQEFNKYGKSVCFVAEFFLPDMKAELNANADFEIKVMEMDEIPCLYDDKRFPMALGYDTNGEKQDVLAVVGYKNGKIIGVAGASNDCDTMWQVGIDVVPEYRNKGVGTILTKLLTKEILERGKVPFYCTAWSNIASKNNALASGYKTAWVELTAIDTDKALELVNSC